MAGSTYSIQRITARDEAIDVGDGIDRWFLFNYMGSAEFEGRTIPNVIAGMRKHIDEIRVIDVVVHYQDRTYQAFFVGMPDAAETAARVLRENFESDGLFIGRRQLHKERTYMRSAYGFEHPTQTNGWMTVDEYGAPCWALFMKREHAERWLDLLRAGTTA